MKTNTILDTFRRFGCKPSIVNHVGDLNQTIDCPGTGLEVYVFCPNSKIDRTVTVNLFRPTAIGAAIAAAITGTDLDNS